MNYPPGYFVFTETRAAAIAINPAPHAQHLAQTY